MAISNPCFEVWLYYHLFSEKPHFENLEKSKAWKPFLNQKISGGFNPNRHTALIEQAATNSSSVLKRDSEGILSAACSDVHLLAEKILEMGNVRQKLNRQLEYMNLE